MPEEALATASRSDSQQDNKIWIATFSCWMAIKRAKLFKFPSFFPPVFVQFILLCSRAFGASRLFCSTGCVAWTMQGIKSWWKTWIDAYIVVNARVYSNITVAARGYVAAMLWKFIGFSPRKMRLSENSPSKYLTFVFYYCQVVIQVVNRLLCHH